jgi:hypothetical protein
VFKDIIVSDQSVKDSEITQVGGDGCASVRLAGFVIEIGAGLQRY